MDRTITDLSDVGEVEKGPMMEGRSIMIHFMPRQSTGAKTTKEKENA
jgi:translation initiation factor IF-3